MIDTSCQAGIDIKRLKTRMDEMASIGATDKGGVTRLALTEEDRKARNLFLQWMNEIGLDTRVDDMGNIYGRLEGRNPQAPPVLAGSHLDSVPKGGRFDGTLGVLAALEVVETIKENGIEPLRPIEVVSFTNEEGARFSPQMLGSGAITGKFSKEYVYSRTDVSAIKFEEELQKIGFMGDKENRPGKIHSFIELHIEQGPVLEHEGISVGIVEGIQGFYWLEVKILGQSDHSGSTPMNMRKDSLVTASSIIYHINQWASDKGDGTVATVGRICTFPGIINAIPGETVFTLDIRNFDLSRLNENVSEVKNLIKELAKDNHFEINEIGSSQPVRFSSDITNLLEAVCNDLKYPYKKMISGAGHDAMYLNQVADTAMVFVPSTNGKSHCEEEHTSYADIEKGVNVFYQTICKLAGR